MLVENKIYSDFKPYSAYVLSNNSSQKKLQKESIKQNAFLGAATGCVVAMVLSGKTPEILSKTLSKDIKKDSILVDYLNIGIVALLANLGGVVGGSLGCDKEQMEEKSKEGIFQFMNIMIPMTLVTLASALCKNTKALNNNICKVLGTVVGVISGVCIATKITNLGKEKEEKRKYTIKDALAHLDDIVATIKIGFKKLAKAIPVDIILPFIYLYNGARAGSVGEEN